MGRSVQEQRRGRRKRNRIEKERSIQGDNESPRWLLILPGYKTGSGGTLNQVTGGGVQREEEQHGVQRTGVSWSIIYACGN